MSKIVYASDLHGNREAYERLFSLEAEAVVLGGDLLPYPLKVGGDLLKLQTDFARWLASLLDTRPCFWILGNDDWAAMLPILEGHGTSIHGRAVPFLDGLHIAGYSCVPVTPFGMKDFDRIDIPGWLPSYEPKRCLLSGPGGVEPVPFEAVQARDTIEADLQVLEGLSDPAATVYVAHSPPYATKLDRLNGVTPIGSRALRRFIDRRQPPLTLHGHVHESPGVDRLGGTVSVNPGDSMQRLRAVRIDLKDRRVEVLTF